MLQCVVTSQLFLHMTKSINYKMLQFGVKSSLFAEAALHVTKDLQIAAADSECVSILLGLSTSFYTLDYSIFAEHLRDFICLSGSTLQWLKSFFLKDYSKCYRKMINQI